MATLTGKTIAGSYKDLLKINANAYQSGVDSTLRAIEDGDATASALWLATDSALISGADTKLYFYDADGGEHISADASGVLNIAAAAEIDLTATAIDLNGTLDLSSTLTIAGVTKIGASAGSGADAYLYTAGTAAHVGIQWDADGNTEGTLIGGADDHGVDFKFFGETSGAYIQWDQSADDLVLAGAAGLDIAGDIDVDGTANLDIVDIDGAVDMASTLQVDGSITSSDGATITTADNTDTLTLISTDADANVGPSLNLYRNSGSPADSDNIGILKATGRNDNSQDVDYVINYNSIGDASDGTENGRFETYIMLAGTNRSRVKMDETEAVFNNDSADLDFRVESNGDANMLFVDGGNNRVGIGTASPDDILEVENSGGAASMRLNASSGNETNYKWAEAGTVTWRMVYDAGGNKIVLRDEVNSLNVFSIEDNSAADSLYINSSGNVGIGLTAPAVGLDVHHDNEISAGFGRKDDATNFISIRTAETADNLAGVAFMVGSATQTGVSSGYQMAGIAAKVISGSGSALDGELGFYTNSGDSIAQKMVINKDGNVGIGTTAPAGKLDVSSNSGGGTPVIVIANHVADAEAGHLQFRKTRGTTIGSATGTQPSDDDALGSISWYGSDTNSWERAAAITASADGTWANNDLPSRITFHTVDDGTAVLDERMRIDNAGNVGIGVSPAVKLHLDSGATTELRIDGESHELVTFLKSGTQVGLVGYSNSDSTLKLSAGNGAIATNANGISIDSSGNVGIGTTAPGQLLDVNSGGGNMIADGYDTHSLAVYKENIEDATGYLDKVLACPAQKWNRKPFVSADEIKEAVLDEFGEDVLIEEAVEAQEAVYETVTKQRQIVVVSEVEEEVSSTEIVLEDGKYVQKTTTETVTKEVSESQWEDVPLYGEDGEQLRRWE